MAIVERDHRDLAQEAERTLRENRAALLLSEARAGRRAREARRSRIAIARALSELRRARILK